VWHTPQGSGAGLGAGALPSGASARLLGHGVPGLTAAPVAERMRQRTSNPYHAGSNPAGGAEDLFTFYAGPSSRLEPSRGQLRPELA